MAERYPIGIQFFEELVQKRGIYVDKTPLLFSFMDNDLDKHFFFSRPRRFGKSLLISTLTELFKGKKELFKDLWIYDKIEWKTFPIIRIYCDGIGFQTAGLALALEKRLSKIAKEYEVELVETAYDAMFSELIKKLYEKYEQQVVVLIDEYDKPITEYLEDLNYEVAEANQRIMKGFYGILKSHDDHIRFLFITGITKFTRVSIFSELNHLKDITLDERFATLCGYTQAEIEHYFPEGIANLATKYGYSQEQCLQKLKDWYDGFSWDGVNFLYNPFSFLRVMDTRTFDHYWFETGTPTFLIKLLEPYLEYNFENIEVPTSIYSIFNLRKLNYITLMLQSGYLSIKKITIDAESDDSYYTLDFSNKEVRYAFNQMLLANYISESPPEVGATIYKLKKIIVANDISTAMEMIGNFFTDIPSELFTKKDKHGNYKPVAENFYHAIIYLIFKLLGVKIHAEVSMNQGRIDAVIETAEHIYLFEFKRDQSPQIAITQIKARKYPDKYAFSNKKIHLIGVNFTFEKRGIESWEMESL